MKQVRQFGSMVSALVWALMAGYGTYAAAAEDVQQDHSAHGVAQQKKPAKAPAGAKPAPVEAQAEMDHSQMDHSQMDHSQMDHSQMDHSQMDHSQMDHSQMDHSQMDHSQMDHSQMDHSQMDHSQMDHGQMDHGQMDHSQMEHGAMQGGAEPAATRDPHAYSGGYDFGLTPRLQLADEAYMFGVMANRLERVFTKHGTLTAYDVMVRAGKNYDRLVVKAEGEVDEGKLHEARSELLWGHALATFWDAQLGMRQDSGVMPARNWLAAGVQGLAPYWFEVDAAAYLGEQGQFALRVGAEYELLLTQRLILQPRMESNYYAVSDVARGQGAGVNNLLAGIRLRYEIRREIAPYVGVEWSGKLGETADLARAGGAETSDTRWVAGLRFWY